MDDGAPKNQMTVVLRWQPNPKGDGPRPLQLEDGESREWDPVENATPVTGFLPDGWPRGSVLTFKRIVGER
jgi:hypothetical protein